MFTGPLVGRRALIVDDDHDLARIYALTVQQAGFVTDIRLDGRSTLDFLAIEVPDLILLDLNLPDMTGREILRHVRADPRMIKTRVIIISANPIMASEVDAEADLVLLKPTSIQQLRDLVGRLSKE